MSRQTVDPAIVIEVANALYALEEKVDAAMQEAARFTAQLVEARIRSGVSIMVGQEALESASGAVAVLAQVRREMVKTHGHLHNDQLRLGLRHVMTGPWPDKTTTPTGGGITAVKDRVAAD